ncbi:hypothetical protein FHS61_001911 [Altererythrobacter atlanticus]|uniref:Uncharacterized protein n=1 Tax=Croceibacterium atlanticum TaxID=1267766 RepID=A0A0F7KLK3_9SPHN|nr:hypothetical protein [Croceibacterium atlanticum]AKH41423.1 hypothetical protein WYH_00361 [Croceibacterium atlanticum]MBB5732885.1 hypothetical protein [Croceibacterium atlanticum]
MKALFAIPALALLASCGHTPDAPIVENGPPAEGGLVPLGQPVNVGRLVATPVKLVTDSRCPENARCIRAGELIVTTRIDGAGWRETQDLTLGEPHATHGTTITLVSGLPGRQAGQETPAEAYLFAYEGGE